MTTRTRHKWLLIYATRTSFVARSDSPAAQQAKRDEVVTSKFRTLGGAYAKLRQLRGGGQPREVRP